LGLAVNSFVDRFPSLWFPILVLLFWLPDCMLSQTLLQSFFFLFFPHPRPRIPPPARHPTPGVDHMSFFGHRFVTRSLTENYPTPLSLLHSSFPDNHIFAPGIPPKYAPGFFFSIDVVPTPAKRFFIFSFFLTLILCFIDPDRLRDYFRSTKPLLSAWFSRFLFLTDILVSWEPLPLFPLFSRPLPSTRFPPSDSPPCQIFLEVGLPTCPPLFPPSVTLFGVSPAQH